MKLLKTVMFLTVLWSLGVSLTYIGVVALLAPKRWLANPWIRMRFPEGSRWDKVSYARYFGFMFTPLGIASLVLSFVLTISAATGGLIVR
jgi:hypothetical protein